MNRLRLWIITALVVGLAAGGCGADGTVSLAMVRDSAGIRIVEYDDIPQGLPVWVVAHQPDLSIGSAFGQGPDLFGRVVAAVEASDGTVVVADALHFELRAFDPAGEFRWSAGRRGEGPGEFSSLSAVVLLRGDSVLVVDRRAWTVFGPSGEFARRTQFSAPEEGLGSPEFEGVGADGRLFAWSRILQGGGLQNGRYRLPHRLLIYQPSGTVFANSIDVPGTEFWAAGVGGGAAYVSMMVPQRMGLTTQLDVVGTRAIITSQDRFEVLAVNSEGDLDMILRVNKPRVQVDTDIRSAVRDAGYENLDWVPEELPAIGRVLQDALGRIWIQEYAPAYATEARNWWIFDPEGEIIAFAEVPAGLEIQQLESDHVLGLTSDSLDVTYVEKRSILRP